jgi:UDP-N-acetylglucosamine 4,6-dehydratase
MKMNWSEQVVLVTGGTGSFGRKFVELMLDEYHPAGLIVFSRDELKQHQMRAAGLDHASLRYLLGDVRDAYRLERAFSDVTLVVHTAGLKQVPACESNPFEAVQTNVIGTKNVIDAAINRGVRRVMGLSTDKAVHPISLYGATKMCAEKMLIQANARDTRFSCMRYGNFLGSRSSVIPLFAEQRKRGKITVTDFRMSRFWITLDRATRFLARCLEEMHGGEIFVPKMPSMKLLDMAQAVAPNCQIECVGIRPGEKLHEVLLADDEARNSVEREDMFVIQQADPARREENWRNGVPLAEGFCYASDTNSEWLTAEDLYKHVEGASPPLSSIPNAPEHRIQ